MNHSASPVRSPLVLTVVAFLAFVSLGLPDGVLGVAWPSVRNTFGLPLSALGQLLLTSTLGYLLSSFFSGTVVARLGVGQLLLVSSLLVVISQAMFAAAPSWAVMLAGGVLAGLGAGAIDAGINAYSAERFSPRLVTWLHACYGVGATLGPIIMTVAISASHWRAGYIAIGTLLVGMTVCFAITRNGWGGDAHPATAATTNAPPLLAALRRPAVWLGMALFFVYTGLEVTAGQWAYSLLVESRGVSPRVAGVCVSAYWASLTVGRIAFGQLAAHVAPNRILRACTLMCPMAAGMLWVDWGLATSAVAIAVLGFVLAPVYPLLISNTPARMGPELSSHGIGLQVFSAYLGVACLPGIAGILARNHGLETIGLWLTVLALVLLITHEIVIFRGKKE